MTTLNPKTAKRATDDELLRFYTQHKNLTLGEISDTDMENWSAVYREIRKRKIGPRSLNVSEAARWKAA